MRGGALLAVAVVAVGLSGCGTEPAPRQTPSPAEPVQLSVLLLPDVTEAQQLAVEARLRAVPGASRIIVETGEEAYEAFRELFEQQPELVEAVRPEDLPASVRATLPDRASAEFVAAELRQLPGVDVVFVPPATATRSPSG